MTGEVLSHYRLEEKLGEGGMGVLYRATDTRLGRTVAIKLLRPETVGDPVRKRRFMQEARASSALNHPNIVTIYDIDNDRGLDFIVMEYVDGESLDVSIEGKSLPLEQALRYAVEIVSALTAAHAAGIVHRDIKPANLMVGRSGHIKVLDFGLAKLIDPSSDAHEAPTRSVGVQTEHGVVMGTAAYMSPEQAEGKPVDARSDIFSLGTVFYQMLSGLRPFRGDSQTAILSAILRDTPAALSTIRPDVPADLENMVHRCFEKDPAARYPSTGDLLKDVLDCQARLSRGNVGELLRRPRMVAVGLLVAVAACSAVAWVAVRSSRIQWARETALPEIARLTERGEIYAAYELARRAERYVAGEPALEKLLDDLTMSVTIETTPQDAEVYTKSFKASAWEYLGRSPIENRRLAFGILMYRAVKEGFETAEGTFSPYGVIHLTLERPGDRPEGMVRVPGDGEQRRGHPAVSFGEYWLDRYEVTNREFKSFVESGGYRQPEHWKHPLVKEGNEISREEAMVVLRDRTGRPGPASWELGTYPDGRADFPVNGVSWYEAAAYCEFAGKSLPTIHHWYQAAGVSPFADMVWFSNFSGKDLAPVGSYSSVGPYGTYDMAGNVKEWCWNPVQDQRCTLGGGWNEPIYMFGADDAAPPFSRFEAYGFRCARYPEALDPQLVAPLADTRRRDFNQETPVGDDVFEFYRSVYSYDRTELKAVVESVEEAEHWRKEKITFDAAYGGERVIAQLFLPKNAAPPFQTVIFFPGSGAQMMDSSEQLEIPFFFDFIPRTGRALLYPVYKSTYERRIKPDPPYRSNAWRDVMIQCAKDMSRSIDYLETRQDIDSHKLAYYGLSWGAGDAIVAVALENRRLKTSILLAGGLDPGWLPPEIDPFNFAPRITMPVLMLNGRHDFVLPLESTQKPMFRFLGTPPEHKRHVLFDSGHVPPTEVVIKEVLDWLDRYLGPVVTRS